MVTTIGPKGLAHYVVVLLFRIQRSLLLIFCRLFSHCLMSMADLEQQISQISANCNHPPNPLSDLIAIPSSPGWTGSMMPPDSRWTSFPALCWSHCHFCCLCACGIILWSSGLCFHNVLKVSREVIWWCAISGTKMRGVCCDLAEWACCCLPVV